MNKEQLIEKMYNYYKEGINNVNSLIDLKKEIRNNLETLQGIEEELDACRFDFAIIKEKYKRYDDLIEIWQGLNHLKTEYERENK